MNPVIELLLLVLSVAVFSDRRANFSQRYGAGVTIQAMPILTPTVQTFARLIHQQLACAEIAIKPFHLNVAGRPDCAATRVLVITRRFWPTLYAHFLGVSRANVAATVSTGEHVARVVLDSRSACSSLPNVCDIRYSLLSAAELLQEIDKTATCLPAARSRR